MAEEEGSVGVKFGGETSGLDAASARAKSDISGIGKVVTDLGQLFRGMSGNAASALRAIGHEASQLPGHLGEAKEAVDGFGGSWAKILGLTELIGFAFGGLTAVMAIPKLLEFGEHMGEISEKLQQNSQRLGINTVDLAKWGGVMTLNGMSMQQFITSATRLERSTAMAAGGAKSQSNAFKQLGIDVTTPMSPSERLLQISDKMANMDNGPRKVAIAMQLMGRGGTQMIPILNKGSEAIKEQMAETVALGAAFDDNQGKMDAFQQKGLRVAEAFNEQKLASMGLKDILFDQLGPVIASTVEGFTGLVKEMVESYRAGGAVKIGFEGLAFVLRGVVSICQMIGLAFHETFDLIELAITPVIALVIALGEAAWDALHGRFGKAADDFKNTWKDMATLMKAQLADMSAARDKFQTNSNKLWTGEDGKKRKPLPGVDDSGDGIGGGGAKKSMVPIWQGELSARMAAEKNYFGDSKAEELAFWQDKLSLTTKGSKDQAEIQSKIYQLQKGLANDALQADIATLDYKKELARDDYETQIALENQKVAKIKAAYGADSKEYQNVLREKERMEQQHADWVVQQAIKRIDMLAQIDANQAQTGLNIKQTELDAEVHHYTMLYDIGAIGERKHNEMLAQLAQQRIAAEMATENESYRIAAQAIADKLDLGGIRKDEAIALNNQLETLTATHESKMFELGAQRTAAGLSKMDTQLQQAASRWASIFSPIGDGFASVINGMINRTNSFGNLMRSAASQVLSTWTSSIIGIGTKWVAMEVAKTVATLTGNTTRTAADTAGATASVSISAIATVKQIAHAAALAAARVYAAIAAIPIVGPVLAPIAAAAALFGVLALGKAVFSAKRGVGNVANDGDMYELHKDEMVLPQEYATGLRGLLSGLGPRASGGAAGYMPAGGLPGLGGTSGGAGDSGTHYHGDWHFNGMTQRDADFIMNNKRKFAEAVHQAVKEGWRAK